MNKLKPKILYGGEPTTLLHIKENFFHEIIFNKLTEIGDQVILINGNTFEEYTATQLLTQSLRVAKSLKFYGIKKNDIVAIISENRLEFLSVWFGTAIAGAIFAPLNPTYSNDELTHLLNISQPKTLFISNNHVANGIHISSLNQSIKNIIAFDFNVNKKENTTSVIDFLDFLQKSKSYGYNSVVVDRLNKTEQDTALVLSSSGTSGLPKCVEHTDNMLIKLYKAISLTYKEIQKNKISTVRCLTPPWCHLYGLGVVSSLILSQFKVVFFQRYHGKELLYAIEKYKVDHVYVIPPILLFLAKSPLVKHYNLSSVREFTSGAAVLSENIIKAINNRFGSIKIRQGYGMTEIVNVMAQTELNMTPGNIGKLIPGTWGKVIDTETGQPLGPGECGEILLKGGNTMKGYLNNPKATMELIDKDGWVHTGDIGYYNDNEEWFFVDRLKEIIKYKGYQVPPAELEAILYTHPKIFDAGVVGISNVEFGELATAFVVLKTSEHATVKEICDYVAQKISPAKRLYGGVIFVSEIPKTNTGKILRRQLKKIYTELRSKL